MLAAQLLPTRALMSHRTTVREVAITLSVAAVLRFWNLGAVGLNSDEAVYAGQSASLAGNPHFTELFPIVRAHPLLMQLLMAPLYRSGVVDTPGRYVERDVRRRDRRAGVRARPGAVRPPGRDASVRCCWRSCRIT